MDGVMDTWALAPSAEREVVAAAGFAGVGTGLVLSGRLPFADIVGMLLVAIPADMVVLWARLYSSPEAQFEELANRVRHLEVERSS